MFQFSIQTPERQLFSGEVDSVELSSELGALSVLPNHADLLAAMGYSKIVVNQGDTRMEYVGRRGVFSFENASNSGALLMLDCHLRKEFTLVSAQQYLDFIEKTLSSSDPLSKTQLRFMEEEKYMLERQVADLEE